MKKILTASIFILLAAAGCNKAAQNNNTNTSNNTSNSNASDLSQSYINNSDKYSLNFPSGYEIRSFNDYGTDIPATSTSSSIAVRKVSDPNNDFFFGVSEDSTITKLTLDAVKSEISKNHSDPSNYTVSSTTISGIQAYKVVYTGSDKGVISDFYYVQQQNQGARVLTLTIEKNNSIAQQIFNSFKFNQ